MIKIWRVEDKTGLGCYRVASIPFIRDLIDRHDRTTEKHPTPSCDYGIERNLRPGEICGFINKEQALIWFDKEELKELAGLGFYLKEVEVKEITARGEKQVLAIR
jgi:hypothetical protein